MLELKQYTPPYEILDRTFVRGMAKIVGKAVDRTEQYIRSWCRAPQTPADPNGTGRYSPLHYIVVILHVISPLGKKQILRYLCEEIGGGTFMPPVDDSEIETNIEDIITLAALTTQAYGGFLRGIGESVKDGEITSKEAVRVIAEGNDVVVHVRKVLSGVRRVIAIEG